MNDYIPFYFTPFSPMMYNIHTGRGEVAHVANEDICILVSDLHRVSKRGLPFVFTDRHACTSLAQYYDNLADLRNIDWALLQARNFARNPDDPEQIERYQAEALIHWHLPVEALLGVICYNDDIKAMISQQTAPLNINMEIHAMSGWYF